MTGAPKDTRVQNRRAVSQNARPYPIGKNILGWFLVGRGNGGESQAVDGAANYVFLDLAGELGIGVGDSENCEQLVGAGKYSYDSAPVFAVHRTSEATLGCR